MTRFAAILCVLTASNCLAEDWPQWRGRAVNNHAASGATAPVQWGDELNINWKAAIPGRGNSSPTVVGDRIYLTTGDEKKQTQSLLILDRASGELLKEVVAHRGKLPKNVSGKNSHANATVACDGESVFAMFLNDEAPVLTAFSLDGEQQWQRRVCGETRVHFEYGFGSSPIVADGLVIVATEFNKDGSGLHAFDPRTGEPVWHTERPKQFSYSTPMPAKIDGRNTLLMCGNNSFAAYEAKTGKELWKKDGPTLATCGTMIWDEGLGLAFASGGHPDKFTAAIRLDGDHEIVWQHRAKCYEQSLLTFAGYVYAVTDVGVAYCWRGADGKEMWRKRLGGNFSSSPFVVGKKIYATNESGTTYVFEANSESYKELGRNQLGDLAIATPAPVDNILYHRYRNGEQEYLAAIGEDPNNVLEYADGKAARVLIVTGGHDYDKPEFAEMFESMQGIQPQFALTDELEALSIEDIKSKYDTVLFMDMVREKVPSEVKDHYIALSESGVGLVFLHFTLASRPYWDGYHEMVGGKFYLPNVEKDASLHSTYTTDMTVKARVLNNAHPVTLGMTDFTITDAFYGNISIAPGAKPLLASSNDKSSTAIAWTHKFGNSQVVYLMPGFTKQAYGNKSYQRFLKNAIRFVAQ